MTMTTITHSSGVITPTVVEGYEAGRTPGTLLHKILGSESSAVTLRPVGMRKGTLRCVFATRVAAQTAFGILSVPQVLRLADADVPNVNMSFVVADGELTISLEPETRNVWIVAVPFHEVAA